MDFEKFTERARGFIQSDSVIGAARGQLTQFHPGIN